MKAFIDKKIPLIIGDLIIVLLSVYGATFIRFHDISLNVPQHTPLWPKAVFFSFIMVLMCFLADLYDIESKEGRKTILVKIFIAGLFAAFIIAAFYYFSPLLRLGRGIFFIAFCISVLGISLCHILFDLWVQLPVIKKRVIILGTGYSAEKMGSLLTSRNNGYALAGYVNCVNEPIHVPLISIIGGGEQLLSTALKERAQKVVVSLTERRGSFPVREVLDCKLNGIDVVDGPSFYEQLTGQMMIDVMTPSDLIFSDGFRITPLKRYIKRAFDVIFAAGGIVLSLPLLVIIPVLIKLGSKGAVLFRQDRVGEGEKIFTIYKFRTMVEDAEDNSGPVWSQEGDDRITRLGKILRKLRMDELPQLINVIRGEMSFVGPRPERPFFVETLKKQIPYYSERHSVKPGITGWAQVRYGYGDSVEDAKEKMKYDLYYIKHYSIVLEFLIVLDTIKVVLFGHGGR